MSIKAENIIALLDSIGWQPIGDAQHERITKALNEGRLIRSLLLDVQDIAAHDAVETFKREAQP